jgi:predicted amidohydrolase
MRDPLVIAVAQPRCGAGDVAGNAAAHAEVVRSAAARVVVFPELSLTGYELDTPTITVTDDRLAPIVDACGRTGTLALVGAPVEGNNGPHIAMLAIRGTDVAVVYRKIYVGRDEAHRFVPGQEPVAIDVDGWRLGLAICRDTGIPQHRADTAALGIDVYIAGTVMLEIEREIQDERARTIATDYGVAVALASFAGPTGSGYDQTAGHSGIWSRDGVPIAQATANIGELVSATLR